MLAMSGVALAQARADPVDLAGQADLRVLAGGSGRSAEPAPIPVVAAIPASGRSLDPARS